MSLLLKGTLYADTTGKHLVTWTAIVPFSKFRIVVFMPRYLLLQKKIATKEGCTLLVQFKSPTISKAV